ncbi:hypothetical protein K3495_g11002 [Podosphaera aphanis]|nr:hypothetical protein K3495_g11002 [Podosphaera aphanis]
MIVESHWRIIKCDFLYWFNLPRIDLVIWVLTSRAISQGLDRIRAIQLGNFSKGVASWRKTFKKQWKQYKGREIGPESLQTYHTDALKWTCGCQSFLLSRFLLCKHIIHCFEDFEDSIKFFGYVRRQRTMPFWVDRQLILRPEFQASFSNFSEDNGEVSAFEFDSDETETVEDSEDAYLIAEDDDNDESEAINLANTKAMMLEAIEICEQQNALGNTKFERHFCMKNACNQTLVEEIRHINNQQTMAKNWGAYKHPSSMYHIVGTVQITRVSKRKG